jgi:hypothetical protein
MVEYPSELPMESVRYLLNVIPSREFDTPTFALHVWNLQGYAQSALLGGAPVPRGSNAQPSDEEARAALIQLESGSEGREALSFPLAIVLRWALRRLLDTI